MNQTRKLILAVTVAAASFGAQATSNDDNGVQKQIDDLKAGLHQVHMNTLQKYSESWGLEDRANIAKLQETKLDKSVFAADQTRQDKALADSVTKQAATDAKQTSDLKGYADKKADSAYTTAVQHTDTKVARADADRAKGDAALQAQITGNLANQSARDAGQDQHINAVQDAAQAANDSAGRLSSAIQETNGQLAVADGRSINNAVRLDGVEQQAGVLDGRVGKTEVRADNLEDGQRAQDAQMVSDRQQRVDGDRMLGQRIDAGDTVNVRQDTRITENSSDIVQLYSNGEYAQQRIDAANANIQANRNAISSTNRVVAQHSEQLANHEQRLGNLEQETQKGFASMDKRLNKVKKSANAGTSAALSAASIPQVTEYQTFAIGASAGGYEGEQAIAVGFSARVTGNMVVKAAVTRDTDQGTGWNVGTSIGW